MFCSWTQRPFEESCCKYSCFTCRVISPKMSAKLGVDFLKAIADYSSKANSFERWLRKIKITDGGAGRCVAEFTVSQDHLNVAGKLHSGLTATIIDNLTTYALMSHPSHPGVSVDLKVRYLEPAKENDELVIDANTVRAGKSLAFVECELRRKRDGKIIAKGVQTKYINYE